MALKGPVSAVTAKEAAIKDAASLKSVAERLDPKDAITAEGKASKEQALAESAAAAELTSEVQQAQAAQEFQPIGPDVSLSNFALEGTGQDQDADQDGAADLLLSPGTSGSRSITLDDVLANVPEETGDFFVDTFPSQSGSISSGSASPDWETIRTLLGLPESEFDSNGAPPPRDNSAIADTGSGTTQAGTALVNMTVGKDGEVKGGGTTSDDPFLNAASNAITGQLGNARDAMNNALQDQDSIGSSAPGAAVDDGSKKNGTTVVHDAGPDKNGNPTTMTVWTSDDGKIE